MNLRRQPGRGPRTRSWDLLFVVLALVQGAALLRVPSVPLIALGLWWNANTIAHNFIHRPFFRSRRLNAAFSVYESLVLGLPQRLWRDRHLAHHAGRPWRWQWSRQLAWEGACVLALWGILAAAAPGFVAGIYLPGWLAGLALCWLQGHYEHAGATTSHYGWFYNVVFFNDGYHREHHARPWANWSELPAHRPATEKDSGRASRWPAVLRWLDRCTLDDLERLVLRSPALQQLVLRHHERAFRALLSQFDGARRVGIVGGGMFPRTALILGRLLPGAQLTVIDASADHLATAREFTNGNVRFVRGFFRPTPTGPGEIVQAPGAAPTRVDFDLVVVPLAFTGQRRWIYDNPPAPTVLVHDWLWRRRGRGVRVSCALLKRLNLVQRPTESKVNPGGTAFKQPQRTATPTTFEPLENRSLARTLRRPEGRGPAAMASSGALGFSLFALLVLARVLILLGRDVPLSWWSPLAFLWQDVLCVLVFAAVARLAGRRAWIPWTLYGAMAFYVAVNLPLVRYLSSPLTVPMLRAARGTIADSIRHQLSGATVAWMGLVLAAAAALPCIMQNLAHWRVRNEQWRHRAGCAGNRQAGSLPCVLLWGAGAITVALGPFATTHVDTGGLHRNFLVALVESAVPRLKALPMQADWRAAPWPGASPDAGPAAADGGLARFRGAARGRNVVLVLLESTGATYLNSYGAARNPMPRLSRLASEAIQFNHASAVYPESIKGLFSILCSRYPALDTPPEVCARVRTPSLAECLAAEGYRTALFHSGRFDYLGMDAVVRGRGFQTLEDAGDIGGNHHSSFGVEEPATVERMLGWIDSLATTDRFFLTYLPVAGHHPYDSPDGGPFPGADDFGRYLNALHYSDAALGRFIDGLRARGLFERTLFCLAGDHGEAFGQHPGNYGHTLFVFEENIHVPWLIVAPGLVRGRIRVDRQVSLIDAAPTLLDMVGARVPEDYQGSSQLRAGNQLALFYTDYSLALPGLRDRQWKFILDIGSGRARLFDLGTDPGESVDLASIHPDRVRAYRERVLRWAAAQRDLILNPAPAATNRPGQASVMAMGREAK